MGLQCAGFAYVAARGKAYFKATVAEQNRHKKEGVDLYTKEGRFPNPSKQERGGLSGVVKATCFNKILDPWAEEPLIKKYEQLKIKRGKQNCQENKFSRSYNNRLFLKTGNGQDCTARFVTHSDVPRPRTIESKPIAFDSTTNPNLLSDVVKIKCKNIPLFLTYRVNRNPKFVKRSKPSRRPLFK